MTQVPQSVGIRAPKTFMIEKDIEKELDPRMVQIDERLTRIETLLGKSPASTAKAQAVKLESDATLDE